MSNHHQAQRSSKPREVLDEVHRLFASSVAEARERVRSSVPNSGITRVLRLGNEYERSAMANLVGDLHLEEFVDELIEVVLRDSSPCVRHEAAYALGQIASPRVLELLTKLAMSDSRTIVRHEATLALAGFEGAVAEDCLIALTHDPSREISDSARVAILELANTAEHRAARRVRQSQVKPKVRKRK